MSFPRAKLEALSEAVAPRLSFLVVSAVVDASIRADIKTLIYIVMCVMLFNLSRGEGHK